MEEIPPRPHLVMTPKHEPIEVQQAKIVSTFNSLLPVFSALAAVLAIRLFLLFAVVGAFILAQAAMTDSSNYKIYVLIAYCAFTVLPLVWLDIQGRNKK